MSFGLLRTRNIHADSADSTDRHNAREKDLNRDYEPNFQAQLRYDHSIYDDGELVYNKCQNEDGIYEEGEQTSLAEAIQKRLKTTGVKERKNSVLAIEYVLALSPDLIDKFYNKPNAHNPEVIMKDLTTFVAEKHGWENIVSISEHYDESNPHVHVVVVPVIEKEVSWKNRHGTGTKIENRLCADEFIGGRMKMHLMQSAYHTHVVSRVEGKIRKHAPEVRFVRGIDARKNERVYIQQTMRHLAGPRLDQSKEVDEKIDQQAKSSAEQIKSLPVDQQAHELEQMQLRIKELDKSDKQAKKNYKASSPGEDFPSKPKPNGPSIN